jgi:hypothetical protein
MKSMAGFGISGVEYFGYITEHYVFQILKSKPRVVRAADGGMGGAAELPDKADDKQ